MASLKAKAGTAGVPFETSVPGTNRSIMTHELVAITGSHFLEASLSGAAAGPQQELANLPDQEQDAQQVNVPQASGKRKRGRLSQPAQEGVKVEADAALQAQPAPSKKAVGHVLDVIEGRAPAKLTAAEALQFVAAARHCNADVLLVKLPDYLEPMMQKLPYVEVRRSNLRQACCKLP